MTADLLCRYLAGLSLNEEYTAEERLHFLSKFLNLSLGQRIDTCETIAIIAEACFEQGPVSFDIETTGRDTLYGVERATFPFWRNRAHDGNARGLRDILDDGHEFRIAEVPYLGRSIDTPVPVNPYGPANELRFDTLNVPVGTLVTDERASGDTVFTNNRRTVAVLLRGTGRTVVDLPRHFWHADPARIRRRGEHVYLLDENHIVTIPAGTIGGYARANWALPRHGTAPGDYFVYNTAADFGGEGE